MARKYVDCVQHAVAVHGHEDNAELRDMVRGGIQEGTPAGSAV